MAPRTIFKNIHKLLPGHSMICVPEGKTKIQLKIQRYWEPPAPGHSKDLGEQYFTEEVYRLLQGSVRKRLVSDVPIGVFLAVALISVLSPA